MLALRLPPDLEKRLEALAKRTGRTKSFYAREALLEKIEDLEDYYTASERSHNPQAGVALDDVLAEFDLKPKQSTQSGQK
ncbi:MAG: type II toxin-antitoxin system RelB family antitoxin [Beijerinckiaceae bacterium]